MPASVKMPCASLGQCNSPGDSDSTSIHSVALEMPKRQHECPLPTRADYIVSPFSDTADFIFEYDPLTELLNVQANTSLSFRATPPGDIVRLFRDRLQHFISQRPDVREAFLKANAHEQVRNLDLAHFHYRSNTSFLHAAHHPDKFHSPTVAPLSSQTVASDHTEQDQDILVLSTSAADREALTTQPDLMSKKPAKSKKSRKDKHASSAAIKELHQAALDAAHDVHSATDAESGQASDAQSPDATDKPSEPVHATAAEDAGHAANGVQLPAADSKAAKRQLATDAAEDTPTGGSDSPAPPGSSTTDTSRAPLDIKPAAPDAAAAAATATTAPATSAAAAATDARDGQPRKGDPRLQKRIPKLAPTGPTSSSSPAMAAAAAPKPPLPKAASYAAAAASNVTPGGVVALHKHSSTPHNASSSSSKHSSRGNNGANNGMDAAKRPSHSSKRPRDKSSPSIKKKPEKTKDRNSKSNLRPSSSNIQQDVAPGRQGLAQPPTGSHQGGLRGGQPNVPRAGALHMDAAKPPNGIRKLHSCTHVGGNEPAKTQGGHHRHGPHATHAVGLAAPAGGNPAVHKGEPSKTATTEPLRDTRSASPADQHPRDEDVLHDDAVGSTRDTCDDSGSTDSSASSAAESDGLSEPISDGDDHDGGTDTDRKVQYIPAGYESSATEFDLLAPSEDDSSQVTWSDDDLDIRSPEAKRRDTATPDSARSSRTAKKRKNPNPRQRKARAKAAQVAAALQARYRSPGPTSPGHTAHGQAAKRSQQPQSHSPDNRRSPPSAAADDAATRPAASARTSANVTKNAIERSGSSRGGRPAAHGAGRTGGSQMRKRSHSRANEPGSSMRPRAAAADPSRNVHSRLGPDYRPRSSSPLHGLNQGNRRHSPPQERRQRPLDRPLPYPPASRTSSSQRHGPDANSRSTSGNGSELRRPRASNPDRSGPGRSHTSEANDADDADVVQRAVDRLYRDLRRDGIGVSQYTLLSLLNASAARQAQRGHGHQAPRP